MKRVKKHTLLNGAKVVALSNHGYSFSDGTSCSPQNREIVSQFNLERSYSPKGEVKGMKLNQMKMVLSDKQKEDLLKIQDMADLVIVPFPVLTALRETGERDQFSRCVAYNATKETQRSPLAEKIVDINNWSY